jgi:GNAT superfamily N-acetyltransferase
MSEVTVRPVAPRDETALARLWQALSDHLVRVDPRLPAATPGAAKRYASRLLERRDDPYTRAFVAESGGQVVGFALGAVVDLHPDLFEHIDSGFIADIYVDPAFRRQGIARGSRNKAPHGLSGRSPPSIPARCASGKRWAASRSRCGCAPV